MAKKAKKLQPTDIAKEVHALLMRHTTIPVEALTVLTIVMLHILRGQFRTAPEQFTASLQHMFEILDRHLDEVDGSHKVH